MRLDKYLADMGVGSRSDIRKAIRKGLVTVDGEEIRDAAYQLPDPAEVEGAAGEIDGISTPAGETPGNAGNADNRRGSNAAVVTFAGAPVAYESFAYYMLNKPAGVLSAANDPRRQTVVDLIREGEMAVGEVVRTDLFPIGRLDVDTEGLLVITNDGQLAHRLLAPKHHVDKVYYARVSGRVTPGDVKRFAEGIRYDETLTAMPARLKILAVHDGNDVTDMALSGQEARKRKPHGQMDERRGASLTSDAQPEAYSEIEVTIQEGKFHQIRKMVAALGGGKEVQYLRRISMGPLRLDPALTPGEYRRLTAEEVKGLQQAAGNG